MYIVFPWVKDEDIPKKLRKYIKLYKFSRTGRYWSTNHRSGGRIKTAKKGYRVKKHRNRKAINYQVPANRRKWCWDIHIPYEFLKKAKIKEDPISMIQQKRDKQPFTEDNMPKRKSSKTKEGVKVAPVNTIADIKRALDELEEIGVGIENIINEGTLTKDMIKRYLDDLFEPTDEE